MEEFDFEKEYGFKPPRMVGPYTALILHKNIMAGTASDVIDIPEEMVEKQKFLSNVGRIVYKGDACYKGERFKDWTDLPSIGDWVVFKANSGPVLRFRNIDMTFIFDDSVIAIIENPAHVTRD